MGHAFSATIQQTSKKKERSMNEFETQALALLKSIDGHLYALVQAANRRAAANSPAIADDKDLDSQYGDETVKFSPKDWSGDSIKGLTMSRCPPAALDLLANAFDYFAKRNEGQLTDKRKPKSDYDRRSAARARGWAKRLRAGWKPAKPADFSEFEDKF